MKKLIPALVSALAVLSITACGPEPTTVEECIKKYGQTQEGFECGLRIIEKDAQSSIENGEIFGEEWTPEWATPTN